MQRENIKYSICIALFLLIFSQLFFPLQTVSAQTNYQTFQDNPLNFWTLNDVDASYYENNTVKLKSSGASFTLRKQINITGSTGASTGYQIIVNVTYDSDMQADFDDIRFVASDAQTFLDYWLQIKTDSVFAIFWVKIPDDLGTDKIIYMYYGNADVETIANGENTFPTLFDSFDGYSEPPTWWYQNQVGTLTWNHIHQNGYYKVYNYQDSSAEWHGNEIYRSVSPPTTFAMVARIDITCGAAIKNQHESLLTGYYSSVLKFTIGFVDGLTGDIGCIASSITGTGGNEPAGTRIGEPLVVEIRRNGTNVKTYWNDNLQQIKTETDTIDEVRVRMVSGATSSSNDPQSALEFVFIRKYIEIEPYVASFGDETEQSLDVGNPYITIPLLEDKDVSVKSLLKINEYYDSESFTVGIQTLLGIDPDFQYEVNESVGNPVRFEISCKHLINIYRINILTEFQAYIDRYKVTHLISKDITALIIYLNDFTDDSELTIYFLSGTVDYLYSSLWEYTDGHYPNEPSRYEPDIFTAFTTTISEEADFTGGFNRTFQRQIDNFQYVRCYDNIQYDIDNPIINDNFLSSQLMLTIDTYRIVFLISQLHGGEAPNVESYISIYESSERVYFLHSTKAGYDPDNDLLINNVKIWRTFEDRLGIAFASDSELFRNVDDERRTIEEFTYYYTDVLSNFSGAIEVKYEAQVLLVNTEYVEEQNDFSEMEYDFNADFQIAEPHFSSTWYMMPSPIKDFLDWLGGIGKIIGSSPLAEGIIDFLDFVEGMVSGIEPLFDNLISVLSPLIVGITNILTPALEDLGAFLGGLLENIVDVLQPILDNIFEAFATIFDAISDSIITWAQDAFETIVNLLLGVASAVSDFIIWFINGIGTLLGIAGLSGIIGDIIGNFLVSIVTFLSGFALVMSLLFDGIIFMVTLINEYLPTIILGVTIIVLLHVATAIATMDEKVIMDMVGVYVKIFSFFLDIMFKLANAVIQFIGGIIP